MHNQKVKDDGHDVHTQKEKDGGHDVHNQKVKRDRHDVQTQKVENNKIMEIIWRKKTWIYSLFHKTLPRSSIKMRWISVRFYEMGDTKIKDK